MNFTLKQYMKLSPNDRLKLFLETLSNTNRTPEYYVNWEKVERNTKTFELELNTLNYLVGKKNIKEVATSLFKDQPNFYGLFLL